MNELFPESELSTKDEIAGLIAIAILRKHQRSQEPSAQKKDPDRLDNSATSCMTVNTPEKTTEVAYERR